MKAGSTSAVAVDKLLTGRFTGIPCFFAIMAFVFAYDLWPYRWNTFRFNERGRRYRPECFGPGLESWGLNPVLQSRCS